MFSKRLLAVIPCSLYGDTGDSVNEAQLLEALARRVDVIIVFSLLSIGKVKHHRQIPPNMILINLPIVPFLGLLSQVLYSFLLSSIAYIFDRIWSFDLVYIRSPLLSFGFMLSKKMRKKTIIKFPAFLEDELTLKGIPTKIVYRIFYLIDKVVLTKCKKAAVGSPLWIPKIEEKRNVHRPPSSYLLLPAGYNPEKMSKISKGGRSGKAEGDAKMLRVGFLGSIVEWQGVDVLIRAMRIVQRKEPNIKLEIIGDGPLRGAMEDLSRTLGVDCKITGYLPHDEALRNLSTFDVMVLPSRQTTTTELNIPIKVIEAWALGIPVIVTKHKVFLEHGIRDFEDVVYCEPQPLNVANAILTLLDNSTLREKLKINGLKLAMRFDYGKIAQNLLKST